MEDAKHHLKKKDDEMEENVKRHGKKHEHKAKEHENEKNDLLE